MRTAKRSAGSSWFPAAIGSSLEVKRQPLAVQVDPDVLFIDKTRWNNRRAPDQVPVPAGVR